ncbi:hypothetical protein QQF64_017303, partial [Cirrhinus molitorella]
IKIKLPETTNNGNYRLIAASGRSSETFDCFVVPKEMQLFHIIVDLNVDVRQ